MTSTTPNKIASQKQLLIFENALTFITCSIAHVCRIFARNKFFVSILTATRTNFANKYKQPTIVPHPARSMLMSSFHIWAFVRRLESAQKKNILFFVGNEYRVSRNVVSL